MRWLYLAVILAFAAASYAVGRTQDPLWLLVVFPLAFASGMISSKAADEE